MNTPQPAHAPRGAVPVPTLGVEEEFFLLRPDGSAALVAPQLLDALQSSRRYQPEWMQYQVESVTGVCSDLAGLAEELSTARLALAGVAADLDAVVVASGTPPFDIPGHAALTRDDRYRRLWQRYPQEAPEVVASGCHVHVGVPDRELGVQVINRVRGWLPVLLALSGNSPLWRGVDSGWESFRHERMGHWPSARMTPWCADAAAYDDALEDRIATGAALDHAGVYWLARLSARYPTVEIRVADTGLTVADTVLQAALTRGLVATALADAVAGRPAVPLNEDLLDLSLLNAARYGLGTLLADPGTGVLAPGPAVVGRLVAHIGVALRAAGDRLTAHRLLAERRVRRSGSHRQRELQSRLDRSGFVSALATATLPRSAMTPRLSGIPPQGVSAAAPPPPVSA